MVQVHMNFLLGQHGNDLSDDVRQARDRHKGDSSQQNCIVENCPPYSLLPLIHLLNELT